MELYKLNEQIEELMEAFDYADESTLNELRADIDALELERDSKIESVALWVKQLKSDAVQIKAEEKALVDRRKACEKKAESLQGYLQYALQGAKFSTPKVAVSSRKSTAVVVSCEVSELPLEYVNEKTTFTADKTALKKAITSGDAIEGVSVVERLNLVIK